MHIWITKNRMTTNCTGCGEPINLGESIIRGRHYHKDDSGNVTSTSLVWHVMNRHGLCCWLEEGLLNLEKNPWIETRGRKKIPMSDEMRAKRIKIMKHRGSVMQRLKRAAAVPIDLRDYDLIIALGSQLEELKRDIEPLGGIPARW